MRTLLDFTQDHSSNSHNGLSSLIGHEGSGGLTRITTGITIYVLDFLQQVTQVVKRNQGGWTELE